MRPTFLLLLLVSVAACGTTNNGTRTSRPLGKPSAATAADPVPSGVNAGSVWMPDGYDAISYCDYAQGVTVREVLSWVGEPANGRSAVQMQVLKIDRPRWNTPGGERPTTATAGKIKPKPWIYTPLEVRIERKLKGSAVPARMTVYAGAGILGKDATGGCEFQIKRGHLILREHEDVRVGDEYIAILGDEITGGGGPTTMPAINHLFILRSGAVIGFNGQPEPAP